MDYLFSKVEDVALWLKEEKDPYRAMFGNHLLKVARALHEIEWVDSCDKSYPDDINAIKQVFDNPDELALSVALDRAQETINELKSIREQCIRDD